MKRLLYLVTLLTIVSSANSQTIPSYRFRKPILESGIWKFKSVLPGVDGHLTITGSKNASLDKIDDSTVYAYAWQPNIKFTNRTNNNNDSSYLEFTIKFVDKYTFAPLTQSLLATTIIDCDGPGNSTTFREFIRTAMPGNVYAVPSSTISITNDTKWLYFKSGTTQFSNIDTTNYGAMAQVNYSNVNTLVMRVGVLGKVSANDVRQFSFYFKGFNEVLTPLPVQLSSFNVIKHDEKAVLKWTTSSEEHIRNFEVTRSYDGINFETIGSVSAVGFSDRLLNYEFIDHNPQNPNSSNVFYQLKVIESSQKVYFSSMVQIKLEPAAITQTFSVFPNPAIDKIQLEMNAQFDQIVMITIMDANGQLVRNIIEPSMNGKSFEIDIQELKNGLYFIDITDINGLSASKKFLKR